MADVLHPTPQTGTEQGNARTVHGEIDVKAAALEIKSAQDSARHIPTLTSRYEKFDLRIAYLVAAELNALRVSEGDVAVGRKIGFTNAAVQTQYNVQQPIWGTVYRRTLIRVDRPGATFGIEHMASPARIEPEIAMHFRSSPPVDADAHAILRCIDWIAHGVEIVQSHFADWKFGAPDTVADNGLHGALLIGEPQPTQRLGRDDTDIIDALSRFTLVLSCDGQPRDSGTGANVLGHPLNAIAHLMRVLAEQGQSIQPGETITTGTITAALPITAGQTWTTRITGIALPGIEVRFS
jgi:2-keto-4-pentenoate hydratase